MTGFADMLWRMVRREPAPVAVPHQPGTWPLIVLGMHRSGTSFMTGSLQLAGLHLGNHSTWNPHNLKGNRENGDIVAFHDSVLAARGASWNVPPAAPVIWTEAERNEAQRLVASYGDGPWGFKDPRTLLLVDEWRALFPQARFVGIFRNPVAVSRSLMSRSPITEAETLELWADYNSRLLALHDAHAFPLFCFDDSAPALHRKLNAALEDLGLTPLGDDVFYSPELKHHEGAREPVPARLRPLFNALRARQC